MTGTFDAVVIGAGVNGLAAAAYLTRAGRRVVVVEKRSGPGGLCGQAVLANGIFVPAIAHTFYALDPQLVGDLDLTRHGLRFSMRDAPSVLVRSNSEPLVLRHDIRRAQRSIAGYSKADADAFARYRNQLFALGRTARAQWWKEGRVRDEVFDRMALTGAAAWLDSWFESDALKALLAFDAIAASPLAAGSSLLLVWRAAQEMCGLQGVVAFPAGGPAALVDALAAACARAGIAIRTNATVAELIMDGMTVNGVRLDTDEEFRAPVVVSSLSWRATLMHLAKGKGLGLNMLRSLEASPPPAAAAKINFALEALPDWGDLPADGRFIFAEKLESYALAHAAARRGVLPDDLVMEVVCSRNPVAERGGASVSVVIQPVPQHVEGGWEAAKLTLAAKVLQLLERALPGIAKRAVAAEVITPDDLRLRYGLEFEHFDVRHLLLDWADRVRTPLDGLLLCGAGVEPVAAVSGRAGRIAAAIATRTAP